MTTLLTRDDCQNNEDSNNLFPITIDSLNFPLDNSMRVVFTGHFNGFCVEVKSENEAALLYHMGCFGKGSSSRSKPRMSRNGGQLIMRKRQFHKRTYWHKKFGGPKELLVPDVLLKDIDELTAKIVNDSQKHLMRDVIDLVSSDEDKEASDEDINDKTGSLLNLHEKEETIVIVPNSDSEGEDYFANLKPKCCINKVRIPEKLFLTLQEALFLSYGLGCLQVINENVSLNIDQCWELFTKTDRNFITKYVVYHYFRSKGYIVKPGIKFGGDYLLYREGPGITHADYIVIITTDLETLDCVSVLGLVRMANTTVKEVLIAEVKKPAIDIMKVEDIKNYTIREFSLTRNIPVIINEDID